MVAQQEGETEKAITANYVVKDDQSQALWSMLLRQHHINLLNIKWLVGGYVQSDTRSELSGGAHHRTLQGLEGEEQASILRTITLMRKHKPTQDITSYHFMFSKSSCHGELARLKESQLCDTENTDLTQQSVIAFQHYEHLRQSNTAHSVGTANVWVE